MVKLVQKYLTITLIALFLLLFPDIVRSDEAVIDTVSPDEESSVETYKLPPLVHPIFLMSEEEWNRYIWQEKYFRTYNTKEPPENFIADAYLHYNIGYGSVKYRKSSDRDSDEDIPRSRVIQDGVSQERIMRMHLEGQINERIRAYIHHDSTNEEENFYLVEYKALDDKEFVQEVRLGNILLNINNSKYAIYESKTRRVMGFDTTLKKDDLKIKLFGTVFQSESAVENFRGDRSAEKISLRDYQYVKNRYYQIEPFIRYDNLSSPPAINSSAFGNYITFTSEPADPVSYRPYKVNLTPGSVSVYLDDQDQTNNSGGSKLDLDGGYYNKLGAGRDYNINYATGEIEFLITLTDRSRVYILYSLKNGRSSADPAVRTDQVSGKNFVFIKYGTNLEEDNDRNGSSDGDRNRDGRVNYDIYERKSVYSLGYKKISSERFSFSISDNSGIIAQDKMSSCGNFNVDYQAGTINFILREPLRVLQGQNSKKIYSPVIPSDIYRFTRYSLDFSFLSGKRVYQLKNSDIAAESVSVQVDGRLIDRSLYKVDEKAGTIEFTDPNRPLIGPDTEVTISYDHSPFGGNASNAFLGGIRTDYRVNRNLSLGSTILYSAASVPDTIPGADNTPESNLVLEADASVWLGPAKLGKMASRIAGKPVMPVPVDVTGYFEIAHSRLNVNTFGKAMIDDLESTDEIVPVSLSEKEWQLSSLPSGFTQNRRARLNYKYYRSPSRDYELMSSKFTPYDIDYSIKPGPYNIAESHYNDSDGLSLVLDFDFENGGQCASVATPLSAGSSVDLSSLHYIEIFYKPASGSGNVYLTLDAGIINEDSDGDRILDTEDTNRNGVLDSNPKSGLNEDRGFYFNPSGEPSTRIGSGPRINANTKGDGVLSTEDFNRNGMLDTQEEVITFPGSGIAQSAVQGAPSDPGVRVNLSDKRWHRAVIHLDRGTSFSDNARALLQRAESLRLSVSSDSAVKGSVYIGAIKLVSPGWQEKSINGVQIGQSDRFSVSLVSSSTDSEYYSNSFAEKQKDEFNELYGSKISGNDSVIESSLEITYDALGGNTASATKRLAKPISMMHYRDLVFWINTRSFTIGDTVSLLIGSSDEDYYRYSIPVTRKNFWEEIKLSLSGKGAITPEQKEGNVDLRNIRKITLEVSGHSGRFWFNNLMLSGPETVTDLAYHIEGGIAARNSFYRTKGGKELGKDFKISYIKRGVGQNFTSPGRTERNISEDAHELYSSVEIAPYLYSDASFIREKTITENGDTLFPEEKRGITITQSTLFNISYSPPDSSFRNTMVYCRFTDYDNRQLSSLEDNFRKLTNESEIAPGFLIEHEKKIFSGLLINRFNADLLFSMREELTEAISRDKSSDSDSDKFRDYQKSSLSHELQYRNDIFYIIPRIKYSKSEYVTHKGWLDDPSSPVNHDMDNGFKIPFFHDGNGTKLIERFSEFEHTTGISAINGFDFEHALFFSYNENQFSDYRTLSQDHPFNRSKSGESEVRQQFRFPFNFSSTSAENLRNITISYERLSRLYETGVPYENETEGYFEEKYGISRSVMGCSDTSLNIFKYPPWYFFTGRGNFGNGRDHVYDKLNSPLPMKDDPAYDYTNNLYVQDTYDISSFFSFTGAGASLFSQLSQISERSGIEQLPQQMVQLSNGINLTFDLMQFFSSGFFRANTSQNARHSAQFFCGYSYSRNMFITSNRLENIHSPSTGIQLGRNRKSISLNASVDLIFREKEEYISTGSDRDKKDDKYFENLPEEKLKQEDQTYTYSCEIKSDVPFLYNLLSNIYKLHDYPMFTIRYDQTLNRYDYKYTVSPEPYDLYMITQTLELDVHKNIRGGLTGRYALEKFRDRESGNVTDEILSYEYILGLTVLF